MSRKKWITKKEISDVLKAYSVRTDEFEPFGHEGCSFKNKYLRGYILSIEQEFLHGSEKTGRIIVSHTQSGGKRTFHDIWERDSDNKLQFVFRNPWNKPFTDYAYIKDLEAQIIELKEFARKLQEQSAERHEPVNKIKLPQEALEHLEQDLNALKSENAALQTQVAVLSKKCEELIKKTKHNSRGAGRKADPAHLEAQAQKVQDLLEAGKTAAEVQEVLGISRSSFFKYKKFAQTKGR